MKSMNMGLKEKGPNTGKIALWKHSTTIELSLLVLPGVILMIIFNYIPLYGIIIPFKDYSPMKGVFKSPWVGLDNFSYLLTSQTLVKLTLNTITKNLLFIVCNTCVSVVFALFLFELNKKFVKIYQTAMFFPYFLSWIVVSFMVLGFLDSDYGLANKVTAVIGREPIFWYNEPGYWHGILVILYVWKMAGYGAIIYYAGLMGADKECFESARIDGATKIEEMYYISLPTLKPLIIIINLLALSHVFFGDISLFKNVPLDSPLLYPATDVIDTYVFRAVSEMQDIGMAAAAGLYQAVCGFALILFANFIVRKLDNENALF